MKKNYISPAVQNLNVNPQAILSTSNVVTSDGYVTELKYGGINGELTPETKHYSVWDDDWSQ